MANVLMIYILPAIFVGADVFLKLFKIIPYIDLDSSATVSDDVIATVFLESLL